MNRRTLRNALRILGVTLVVLLPVVLALWFAQIRAKAETSDRLRAFSQLALQKTEMVVYEADRARERPCSLKGKCALPDISNICCRLFAACFMLTI